ncbi:MAG TPA: hypothetical protein VF571_15875 [Pyrinomonadaceae bacterium]|jgi:hypothetical protein
MTIVKSKLGAVLAAGIGLVLVAATFWFSLFETAEIVVLNPNPYKSSVAVRYEAAPGDWQTISWVALAPGEKRTFSATVFRVEPQFFVAAESHDKQLLNWLLETGDTIYFGGDGETVSGRLPKNRDVDSEQTDSAALELEETEEVQFSLAKTGEIYVLTDPLFSEAILSNDGLEINGEDEGFELIAQKARSLHESLHRQKRFEETFKSEADFPFAFEFALTDEETNGFMRLGTNLKDVQSHTLHGDEIMLRDGDVLIGIKSEADDDFTPTYSPADAYLTLHEHSLNADGGITKKLHFLVVRDGELLQIESYYLFNPDFDWDDETDGQAFFDGAMNSISLGTWAQIYGFFSNDPQASWKKTQQIYRAKQLRPGAAQIGEIAGLLVPLPTKILKIGGLARGGRMLGSSRAMAEVVGIEAFKFVVYSYNTSVSNPQSKTLTSENVRLLLPDVGGITLIQGTEIGGDKPILKLKKPSFGRG